MDKEIVKDEDLLIGNNDILYKDIYKFLFRNSRKLITFMSIGLSISFIYAMRLKNIWQGEFQIVIDNENNQINPMMQSFDNNFDFILNNQSSSKLSTEVEILKSSSILIPIYEKSLLREKEHPNNNKPISFRSWNGNLDIKLKKGTSVLNIQYKNTNKESILPILNDISKVYQKHSTINTDNNLRKGIEYLNNQIKIYRKKTNISYEKSRKFALENDLKVIDSNGVRPISSFNNNFNQSISGSQGEISNAAIQKRLFLELAEYFQKEETDNEKLTVLARNYNLVDEASSQELQILQQKINKAKSLFTNNYSKIKQLEIEKEIYFSFIKDSSLKVIQAKIDAADAIIKSSERPDGVYVKYNDLNNKYLRDSYTLLDLESQLRLINLEKAKERDPYKLITVPTLLDQKIGPSRSNILITNFLFLIFFSILYFYIEEKIKNYIYSTQEFESLMPFKLIEKIPSNIFDDWDNYLDSISILYLKNEVKIEIIKLGNIDEEVLERFLSGIKRINPNKDIKLLKNISEINKQNTQLLLTQAGKVTKKEVENFKRRFNYAGFTIIGWILFEESIIYNQPKVDN